MNTGIEIQGQTARRKGHTLLELIIVCGLFLLAGILVLELFKYGTRTFTTVNTRLDNQRRVLKVLNDINRELELSSIESVTFSCESGSPSAGFLAMAFLTPCDANGVFVPGPDNGPLYQAYIIYYYDPDTSSIKRIRKNLSTPLVKPVSLVEDDVNQYINNALPQEIREVLTDVESFKALSPKSNSQMMKVDTVFRLEIKVKIKDEERFGATGCFSRTFRLIK